MKILFVSSGNAKTETGLSPIVVAQGESLKEIGIEVHYYGIKGQGIKGYLKAVKPLKNHIQQGGFDLVHVHYSLSAYAVSLARAGKPIVVSLMGSDVLEKGWKKKVTAYFHKNVWSRTIVKSQDMADQSGLKDVIVQPNGVDFNRFCPLNAKDCRAELNWSEKKTHILFGSNPDRFEKNYALFEQARANIESKGSIEVHALVGYSHKEIPTVINAAHITALSSKWEGSPNFIKESMACNTLTVSTLVGDVEWLFGNETKGCFGSSLSPEEYTNALKRALESNSKSEHSEGRQRLEQLELGHLQVARNLESIYAEAIKKNKKD